jgi:hypothetical protein
MKGNKKREPDTRWLGWSDNARPTWIKQKIDVTYPFSEYKRRV